jgi:PilZ domain
MHFDGRFEKRDPIQVPMYIESLNERRIAEKTVAADISAHGAQVATQRRWQAGEQVQVAPLKGEIQLPARVVHCRERADGTFCIGLHFRGHAIDWDEWPRV